MLRDVPDWEESTAGMNFTNSSQKSWALCRLGAAQCLRQSARPRVTANKEASHLAQVAKAPANKAFERKVRNGWHLFCVLDLRVGHTMDALSPFISVLYHSDSTLPRAVLSMSHPGRSWFFLCCPLNPQNLSQSFHLKSAKTCFFILSECPAFTAVHC